MQISYDNVDITNKINLLDLIYTDNAGGLFDSLEITFGNKNNEWYAWQPEFNKQLAFSHNNITSGNMYIDEKTGGIDTYELSALSGKHTYKQVYSNTFENISLIEITSNIARKHKLNCALYDINNYTYKRLDQVNISDFEFLHSVCMREGYNIKIYNDNLIVYDECKRNKSAPVRTIYSHDWLGSISYNESKPIYLACCVTFKDISQTVGDSKTSDILTYTDIPVSSIDEAQRFAKNLLYQQNKMNTLLSGSITIDFNVCAGTIIFEETYNSKFFVEEVEHNYINKQSHLTLRKVE